MLKNITLSAEDMLIQQARERAAAENSTLNAEFRRWLVQYTARPQTAVQYHDLMDRLSYAQPGRKFTREEMNER
ncbi:MAG: hypothetical protein IPL28_00840 [Chloroflexi bacterium]|nr:hypothetical protein [Chloroflexota bacterium]MDA0244159.1 hypothetical protein [Chloroflexota bacterium]